MFNPAGRCNLLLYIIYITRPALNIGVRYGLWLFSSPHASWFPSLSTLGNFCAAYLSSSSLVAVCMNPNYIAGLGFVACGKCSGCLRNKKKEWSDRLRIESRYHNFNYFVTLTYSPETLPKDESVHKSDARNFVKRLGYYCGYVPRHFGCGEYGDESDRPHYHVCVFGDEDLFYKILESWTLGRIEVTPLTPFRCSYCAGYVLKKLTKKEDPRLRGRRPEFWFGSRKPALGYPLLVEILEKFATDESFRSVVLSHVYPPNSVVLGGKNVRLPRYIRDKLKNIWRLYNEDAQDFFLSQKKNRDRAIFEKLAADLPELSVKSWKNVKAALQPLWQKREYLQEKAFNLKKNKRIL